MSPAFEPLVSVIVPAYNASSTLGRQLRALANQRDAPPFEVLVVDNRSSDEPWRVVDQFREQLDVRLVPAFKHQGVSYARNVGIGAARADVLMFCDADDVAGPRWVAYGYRTFDVAPLWSGSVKTISDAAIAGTLASVWDDLGPDGPWEAPVYEQRDNPFPVLQGGDFGMTRKVAEALGGFDQSLPTRGEDNELALRARHLLGLEVPVSKCVRNCGGKHEGQERPIARADAKAHALLVAKYDLWRQSPFKAWPEEWARCFADGLRMLLKPATRNWDEWQLRLARTIGFTQGSIEFGLLKRIPKPAIGVGWQRRSVSAGGVSTGAKPSASVIIPAYNAGRWIEEQLDSLATQIDAPEFEVVIGDNASTDDTVRRATSGRWPFNVRVVDASGEQSASYARNIAASYARSERLLFCDADDLVNEHWVSTLCRALDNHPEALISGAIHHERFNDADILAAYGIPPDPSEAEFDGLPGVQPANGYAGYLPTVPGGSFAAMKDVYFVAGGMDASYPGGAEETDFSWRLQTDHGVKVLSAPRAAIQYRLKSTPKALFRQQRIQQRGRVLLWVRNQESTMQGPSWKASLLAVARAVAKFPSALGDRASRLKWAQETGAHVGALEGMVRYRLLKRLPAPKLYEAHR